MLMKIIKFFFILIVIIIISTVGLAYLGLNAITTAIESSVAPNENQTVSIDGSKAIVTTELKPVVGIKLTEYKTCSSEEEEALGLDTFRNKGYSALKKYCENDKCTIEYTFDGMDSIPETTELIYVSPDSGECTATRFSPQPHIKTIGYNTNISIHGPLKDFVSSQSTTGVEKVESSRYTSVWSMSYGDKTGIHLGYDEKVDGDTFLYNGKTIEVRYLAPVQ